MRLTEIHIPRAILRNRLLVHGVTRLMRLLRMRRRNRFLVTTSLIALVVLTCRSIFLLEGGYSLEVMARNDFSKSWRNKTFSIGEIPESVTSPTPLISTANYLKHYFKDDSPEIEDNKRFKHNGAIKESHLDDSKPVDEHVEPFKRPKDMNQNLIMYNRLPKCGSESLMAIMKRLGRMNMFNYKHSLTYHNWSLDVTSQGEFVQSFDNLTSVTFTCPRNYGASTIFITTTKTDEIIYVCQPSSWTTPLKCIYDRHLHYVDFKQFGRTPPLYINVIRDPLEQAVSLYYFNRLKGRLGRQGKYTERERAQSFDECIRENVDNMSVCDVHHDLYVHWFCGHSDVCSNNMEAAIKIAKKNINEHALVGLAEEFNNTLKVLEKILPEYFEGVSMMDHVRVNARVSASTTGTELRPSVVELVKRELIYSYTIYKYVKLKFQKTLKALSID
ncbi:unnamed protein product [Owenia fusiformis]|uniref:Uncharacterized protein n=1 Tax=Owenia fusiformis TaxID=6347 RepID=A0A8J1TNX0_OWEFU|nr:unnamed protein product [Owenia fusiformis]